MRLVRAGTVAALAVLGVACDTSRAVVQTAESAQCTQCHGYPPPAYVTTATNHPQGGNPAVPLDCHACHPGTVEADNVTIVPGGLHMDGKVEATGTGHALPFLNDHPAAALADIASCQGCHGADYGGGTAVTSCNGCHARIAASAPDWKGNCTFCHGTRTAGVTTASAAAAPPVAVDRTTNPAKVGAHQAHLTQGTYANALPCTTCHAVPTSPDLSHFTGGAASIAFSALAAQGVASPAYAGAGGSCAVYCHGSGTSWPTGSVAADQNIAWNATTGVTCTSCHGDPPLTGRHDYHVNSRGVACSRCHNGYTSSSVNKSTHPDGVRDVVVVPTTGGTLRINGWDCNTCHSALGV